MKKKDTLLYVSMIVLTITALINIAKLVMDSSNILVPIVNLIAIAGAFIFISITLEGKRSRWLQLAVIFAAQAPSNAVVQAARTGDISMLLMFLPAYGTIITCAWIFKKRKFWIIVASIAEILLIIGSVIASKECTGIDKVMTIVSMPTTWACMMVVYIRRQLEKFGTI